MAKDDFMPNAKSNYLPATYMWHLPEKYKFEIEKSIVEKHPQWSPQPYKVQILLVKIIDPSGVVVGYDASDSCRAAFWGAILEARKYYKSQGISL